MNPGSLREAKEAELSVIALDGDDGRWDEFVRTCPDSSFCHLSGWRDVLGGVLGHECLYRVAIDSAGAWRGVLPLVRVRSLLFGHYLLSMPFLNYGGALGSEAIRARLARDAIDIAHNTSVDLLELRTRRVDPGPVLRRTERKITVVLELPGDPETLWKEVLRSKVRSQIRRPMKEGMLVRFGQEEVEPFYQVFSRNMRDLGTPVLPREFFGRIAEVFSKESVFGCVYLGDEPVAAGCGFTWQGEFEMTWASSLREFNRMAPNMLLYWAFMEEMVGRGIRAFNFGRCSPGSGTHRFKGQWGGVDEPLPWGQWSKKGAAETPNPDRPAFRAAAAIWARLPLPLANRLGPPIARRIP